MSPYDCESIRDMLPAFVRGEMLPHEVVQVDLHLEECAACQAEAGVVRLLQSTLAPVPEGLESRVLTALRRGRLVNGRRTRLALAATLGAAMLGGSLIYDRAGVMREIDVEAVSWAAAQDPLLHGGSELHELSVEQLELLMEEMDP